ncbi:Mu-like prophage major head subunit gpT family protein [Brevundimonas sp.]|uniref:Mu-like prophage major head subunit gpT family protein n=1 Tax=Brevundimonas sp. TaxID=1871086 RepID=UPI002D556C08|nr:Mu-like prophage major head subunit gpT family protein [Brevundimonas sp.]HYD29198.1 Mu-like prophage major head subunit gpT family protein [Brevundimonas sp.]
MSAKGLSSRAIIGRFYQTLEQSTASWVDSLSMFFTSDQAGEEYKWLGQSPAMREWVGGRNAKGFRENGLTITNKHYEATIEIQVSEMRRDKTGQVMVRIDELAERANSHWASLCSALILNGAAGVCYDGQYFFDTDHAEGNSGTQSNSIAYNVGSATEPTTEEMQKAIFKAIAQILSFKDDQGEPMNENARTFLVMVPMGLYEAAQAAVTAPLVGSGASNTLGELAKKGFKIEVEGNVRLTWTDKFAVFRTDGRVKPFIRQQETEVDLKVKAEGSEFEMDNDAHQYGVDSWRNVGYGYWQHACLVTLT